MDGSLFPKPANPLLGSLAATAPDDLGAGLAAIRRHLGMEVAYISRFEGNDSVFQTVDAPGLEHLVRPGDRRSLDDVYCRHILAGRLPELIADTADHALAMSMPITAAVPIGAHMSVPVRGADGEPLGMFCCLSPFPNRSLNERDLQVMRVFADIAAERIRQRLASERATAETRARIGQVLEAEAFTLAFQPICDLHANRLVGFEALCRFAPLPYRSPDRWFDDAFAVGLGVELELAVARAAFVGAATLPAGASVAVNLSPGTVVSGQLHRLALPLEPGRVVLEITEHAPVPDYAALAEALAPLRRAGMRVAIDDAGMGYSGLQHMVQVRPDLVKLDMSLTRAIDTDTARQALAAALVHYARQTGCTIVAEGIETPSELAMLRRLGVPRGQGYLLAKPLDHRAAQAFAPPVLR